MPNDAASAPRSPSLALPDRAAAEAAGWRCAAPSADVLGETPLWCGATDSLLWLDVDQARLHRWHPASGRRDRFAFAGTQATHAGSLALTTTPGQVLLALDLALHRFDLASGQLTPLCQVEPAGRGTRLNDGRCDAQGRFWVGTMDNGLSQPLGSCYRIDPDGTVHPQFGGIVVANTAAFSPDGRRFYFSDTRRYLTWVFDVDPAEGRLTNRRVFHDYTASGERPDGACVDAQGGIWTAIFGGARVQRHHPDGTLDRVLPVPVSNPTCCCLGGPALRTLYVTTARKFIPEPHLAQQPLAGSVLAIEVDVPGLPEARFGAPAARLA